MRMRIALVGNGHIEGCTERLTQCDTIIALDGGAVRCAQLNIVPTVIIGDCDSITKDELAKFTSTEQHITDNQTTTDLQKGITYTLQAYGETVSIELFGVVSEDRIDHTMAAMHALRYIPQVTCVHTHNCVTYYTATDMLLEQPHGQRLSQDVLQRISIVPIQTSATVNLAGLQWSGTNIVITADTYSGISNSIANNSTSAPAHITVLEGEVFVHIFTDSND